MNRELAALSPGVGMKSSGDFEIDLCSVSRPFSEAVDIGAGAKPKIELKVAVHLVAQLRID